MFPVLQVPLCQPEINEIHLVLVLLNPDHEVIRLHIPVQEVSRVHVLQALDHLICQHQHRLHGELALAEIEEVLEAGAEEVHDHDIVVALGEVVVDLWEAGEDVFLVLGGR